MSLGTSGVSSDPNPRVRNTKGKLCMHIATADYTLTDRPLCVLYGWTVTVIFNMFHEHLLPYAIIDGLCVCLCVHLSVFFNLMNLLESLFFVLCYSFRSLWFLHSPAFLRCCQLMLYLSSILEAGVLITPRCSIVSLVSLYIQRLCVSWLSMDCASHSPCSVSPCFHPFT